MKEIGVRGSPVAFSQQPKQTQDCSRSLPSFLAQDMCDTPGSEHPVNPRRFVGGKDIHDVSWDGTGRRP